MILLSYSTNATLIAHSYSIHTPLIHQSYSIHTQVILYSSSSHTIHTQVILDSYSIHTSLIFQSYSIHTPFTLLSYSSHTPFILYSYSSRIPVILHSYSIHTPVILQSYSSCAIVDATLFIDIKVISSHMNLIHILLPLFTFQHLVDIQLVVFLPVCVIQPAVIGHSVLRYVYRHVAVAIVDVQEKFSQAPWYKLEPR